MLSSETLGAAIGQTLYDAIPADVKNNMTSSQQAETLSNLQACWKKVSADIINHIKTNATITVAAGISVSTTGTAAAQTGATTDTGSATIS